MERNPNSLERHFQALSFLIPECPLDAAPPIWAKGEALDCADPSLWVSVHMFHFFSCCPLHQIVLQMCPTSAGMEKETFAN